METKINAEEVLGWGIDADPKNEPTYPMKKYTGDDHERLNYSRPIQQPITIEELHSNERPSMSAVYGTTLPPWGLSGMLRRHAFTYSETQYRHWLTLIMADRVNIVEGLIGDLVKGKIPNIFAEKGMKAEWKYNRTETAIKTAATIAVIATAIFLVRRKSKKKWF